MYLSKKFSMSVCVRLGLIHTLLDMKHAVWEAGSVPRASFVIQNKIKRQILNTLNLFESVPFFFFENHLKKASLYFFDFMRAMVLFLFFIIYE